MDVTIIESPYDSGFRERRTGAGPSHLLESGLIERLEDAGHSAELVRLDLGPGMHPEIGAAAELMRRTSTAVRAAVASGRFPVVLSGNCNAAVGAVSGLGSEGTGVLWFDAHGDLNTPETTESGFFDGMGYAMLLGHGWDSLAATIPGFAPVPGRRAALAGARDLDPPETEHIRAWGVELFPPARLRAPESREALEAFGGRAERVYVHVDLDALDPSALRANALAVEGGLSVSELIDAIDSVGRRAPVAGIGLASYDPETDAKNAGPRVVARILERLLGERERARSAESASVP